MTLIHEKVSGKKGKKKENEKGRREERKNDIVSIDYKGRSCNEYVCNSSVGIYVYVYVRVVYVIDYGCTLVRNCKNSVTLTYC